MSHQRPTVETAIDILSQDNSPVRVDVLGRRRRRGLPPQNPRRGRKSKTPEQQQRSERKAWDELWLEL